jgi:hypothetical protein
MNVGIVLHFKLILSLQKRTWAIKFKYQNVKTNAFSDKVFSYFSRQVSIQIYMTESLKQNVACLYSLWQGNITDNCNVWLMFVQFVASDGSQNERKQRSVNIRWR